MAKEYLCQVQNAAGTQVLEYERHPLTELQTSMYAALQLSQCEAGERIVLVAQAAGGLTPANWPLPIGFVGAAEGRVSDIINTDFVARLHDYLAVSAGLTLTQNASAGSGLVIGLANPALTTEETDDRTATLLQVGAGLTKTYDDANNTLTFNTVPVAVPTLEEIQDNIAAFLVATGTLTKTYDDANNTLTFNAAGGGGTTKGAAVWTGTYQYPAAGAAGSVSPCPVPVARNADTLAGAWIGTGTGIKCTVAGTYTITFSIAMSGSGTNPSTFGSAGILLNGGATFEAANHVTANDTAGNAGITVTYTGIFAVNDTLQCGYVSPNTAAQYHKTRITVCN